ncbi:MAG TPA: ATPase, partial [Euryarchaeota archaeon]|nr:ATPase [Euryarchaeota archaeon]
MRRVPTGIPGLDNLIQGGFPSGSTILLSGGAGTGKTIFALQYIYSGAALYNEPGV